MPAFNLSTMDKSRCVWQIWQMGTSFKTQKLRKQGLLQNWCSRPFQMISCLLCGSEGGAKNKNKTFCKEWKNYLFIIYLFAQNVSSSVVTAQFLQHMPHLVMRASGTVGWILQLERSSSESGADVGSGGDDVGVTPLVAAGSSCWKNVCFLDGLFTNSGFPPLYCSTLLYCEKHVKNRT